MKYSLMFNHLSALTVDQNNAYKLLFDAFQGILRLKQDNKDTFELYFDMDSPDNIKLSEGFTYADFKENLKRKKRDLFRFINEAIRHRAPFLYHIDEVTYEKLSILSCYFPNRPYGKNLDVFCLAWYKNAIMLSMATEEFWKKHHIVFCCNNNEENIPSEYRVYNVSRKEHAQLILADLKDSIESCAPNAVFSKPFLHWYNDCNDADKYKIKTKIKYCDDNDFALGRPIIDTLQDSRFTNMKEIRVGTPHAQRGQIRILFANDSNGTPVILTGFIKHSNDYTEHINLADKLYSEHSTN
ncbi:MAG: type II toxin-antitoxin system RelE/ParE family toxin [Nitrospirae bacterium]|uniref:type II toxin-antitoxin system RelE/ParE family toxin n=1 Tax=Candidatus Magnetobacterium casense TaxID=1455061 RepID=UPI000696DE37|nr:type II toxin-antitoxin system RelE/ParE family toxin [Candidatus Magnetobacterium casensis]MBF0336864.1 type II toxin-antitoxin system RelE/ParE family toxin [Nitrospirota bacterium]